MSYTPRLDTAPESGSGALAAIYCRAIERYEERHAQTNAAGVTRRRSHNLVDLVPSLTACRSVRSFAVAIEAEVR